MDEQHNSLTFFHGFLPDDDVNRLVQQDGDCLLQSKSTAGTKRTHFILALRGSTIRGIEFDRTGNGDFRLLFGSGSYGTVYKELLVRKPLAVKRIDSNKTGQKLDEMMKEARVMQIYDHKNIVKFHDFGVDRPPYLLVMKMCTGIEDKLRSNGRSIGVPFRIAWSSQAARGLEYLHQKMCIHQDIASRNCLLLGLILKLADFAVCRHYRNQQSRPEQTLECSLVGTGSLANWRNQIQHRRLCLWELFIRSYRCPYGFWSASKVRKLTSHGYRMLTPDGMPDRMAVVMKTCWDHQPNKRPTASELRRELDSIDRAIGNTFGHNHKPRTITALDFSCDRKTRVT
ncbi:Non-specific protein-tyrosine kinase [Aphelenchoides besseyi]|nr:Non-specific protein-tyrosine kinase [Aphelenchoides besseyi]